MKSFKEYLIESKKVYEFKLRIAADLPKNVAELIKTCLSEFKCDACTGGKSTPIQESHIDFPDQKNISVTTFDLTTAYPATSVQLRDKIADKLGISISCVSVRTIYEEKELELNYANEEKSGKSVLVSEYEKSDHQEMVGDKKVMSMLKGLSSTKHQGTQYKGVNDQLLADKEPAEKTAKVKTVDKKSGAVSPIGSKKMNNPDTFKGK
ncbi:MAG: hypothetical protein RLZZ196_2015 [Bacteroidota bacterium]|jgi:hypothetical protein